MSSVCTDNFPITLDDLNTARSNSELAQFITEIDTLMVQALDNEELTIAGELAAIQEKMLEILMSFPS